ncbi:phage tail tip fiber protein, partial [Xenorhabdus bovienii]|uniref:phage tail tip fiber protein n=1 Tax=Xenorhabdus bovienii TaxID=40576 RepID=UPI0023B23C04
MNPANGKLESVFMIKDGQVFVRDAFIDMADIKRLLVGIDMKSSNYIPNQRGFRIDANTGFLEINGVGNGYRTQSRSTGWYVFDSRGVAIIELGLFL